MLTKLEKKFLGLIIANPGVAAADLPRAKRGETIKRLELTALIHFGPGGWYPTAAGEIEFAEGVSKDVGGIPEAKDEGPTFMVGDEEVACEAKTAKVVEDIKDSIDCLHEIPDAKARKAAALELAEYILLHYDVRA